MFTSFLDFKIEVEVDKLTILEPQNFWTKFKVNFGGL